MNMMFVVCCRPSAAHVRHHCWLTGNMLSDNIYSSEEASTSRVSLVGSEVGDEEVDEKKSVEGDGAHESDEEVKSLTDADIDLALEDNEPHLSPRVVAVLLE
jgi:hypothetical protein